jgi:hypothetical protein
MKARGAVVLLLATALLVPARAFANCSIPAGIAGDIIYNSTYNVVQFCNGTNWINTASTVAPGTLTNGDLCTTNGTVINCTLAGAAGKVLGGAGVSFTATPTLGSSGTTGTLGFAGLTSGTITIQPQAAAGTYNFNLPTTAGSAGQVLTSQGGNSSAMTWATLSSSTVNSGTQYQLGYYATTGTAVSGDASITTDANNDLLVSSGSVGIGTTSPFGTGTQLLSVQGAGGASGNYGSIALGNASSNSQYTSGSVDFYSALQATAAIRGASTAGNTSGRLLFYTENSNSLSANVAIDNAGKLKIGPSGNGLNGEAAGTLADGLALYDSQTAATKRQLNLTNSATANNSNTELGFGSNNSSSVSIDIAALRAIKSSNTAGAEVGELAIYTRNAGTFQESVRINGAGSVGIGTASPATLLDVTGTMRSTSMFNVGSITGTYGNGGTRPLLGVDPSSNSNRMEMWNSSGAIKAVINYSSNGLPGGISGWSARLGGIFLSSDRATFESSTGGGPLILQVPAVDDGTYGGGLRVMGGTTELMRVTASGNVGIGTSNPGALLDIYSGGTTTARINAASGNSAVLALDNGGALEWQIWNNAGTSNRIQIDNGTHGVLLNQGDTIWSSVSDMRLKTNVETLSVIDRLRDYRTVSFVWKDTGKRDIGVIAQEVYKAFPEAVGKGSDTGEIATMNDPGAWAVQYDKLGALALEGVKELAAKNDELAAEHITDVKAIEELSREVAELRREVHAH